MHLIHTCRAKRGLGYPGTEQYVRRAAKAALTAEHVEEDSLIEITLTDDAGIREINCVQRGIDSATDVLSFPLNELTAGAFDAECCEYDYEAEKLLLGDMVLSLERCAAQADEYGHSFAHEISYLTVHSVLHLLGYDHLDEGPQKKKMRMREKTIMHDLFPEEE